METKVASLEDYTVRGDVSCVRFSVDGQCVAVGSHGGSLDVFSVKSMQARTNENRWCPVWKVDLEASQTFAAVSERRGSSDDDDGGGDGDDLSGQNGDGHDSVGDVMKTHGGVSNLAATSYSSNTRTALPRKNVKSVGATGKGADSLRMKSQRSKQWIRGEESLQGVRGTVKKVGSCVGHTSGVTRMDWSTNNCVLRSTTQNKELLYWHMPSGTKSSRGEEHRDVDWGSHTAIFGWNVKGVWPVGSDGKEVQAVDVSRGAGCVVTGDALRHIKLFKYPCVGPRAMYKGYVGHGDSVVDVRFTEDNARVLSIGGRDNCILQWKYAPKFPEEERLPENDLDLGSILLRPPRVVRQIRRRAQLRDVPACVHLVMEGDYHVVKHELRVRCMVVLYASRYLSLRALLCICVWRKAVMSSNLCVMFACFVFPAYHLGWRTFLKCNKTNHACFLLSGV